MNGSLCLASLIALAMAPVTGHAGDAAKPAAEQQQLAREDAADESSWHVNLDAARREARKTRKPLMMVFR